jgi:hypothetical protein
VPFRFAVDINVKKAAEAYKSLFAAYSSEEVS